MGKKNRQNKPNNSSAGVRKSEITATTVANSKTETEFMNNRDALLEQLNAEIERLNTEKANAEEAAQTAKTLAAQLESERKELESQKKQLQKEYDAIKEEYDSAVETIDTAEEKAQEILEQVQEESEQVAAKATEDAEAVVEKAKKEADEILETAEKERIDKLMDTANEAREKWREQIENLKEQIDEIARREKALFDAQRQLEKDRQNFEIDKEALDEEREYLQQKRQRYDSANPSKVQDLEIEVKAEKDKYQVLYGRYEKVQKDFNEIQVLLDTVKTELEDANGKKQAISLRAIVEEMRAFKAKYEQLVAVSQKYPDSASIAALEEKASRVDKLEKEREELQQERDRYREEAGAARNVYRDLEVARQEIDATNALNEHLLQELQSHKTALESRTGDTCPALSKVDAEVEADDFVTDINARVQRAPIPTLKGLVSHVKNYAGSRDGNDALYYTDKDICAFLAGLAVSRLIILQGMSGTGKSSLPRIFAEAISGMDKLISVESSWRDRNELLGYYNDFNKKFNAKSFTIEFYRAGKKRCQEIPTFIILDEMNLARVEYYFSDFLTVLQKPDHKDWLIELVPFDMRTLPMELPENVKEAMKQDEGIYEIWEKIERSRRGDLNAETSDEEKEKLTAYLSELGKLTGAKDLIDGRKIKVTDNIWFVGTANRDESTFEISDKVYDRAQVISLNKKGVPEGSYTRVPQKYMAVSDLLKLFDVAIRVFGERAEVEAQLKKIDEVLINEFDTSFGNRIVTQAIDFAAVYTAAGGTLKDALDYQISTKIVRKVLSSDKEEAFYALLDVTKGYEETQKLIEKRLKDLK